MGQRRPRASPTPPPSSEAATQVARWGPALQPFLTGLSRSEQQAHATRYVAGLLSGLPQKTTETIAYYFGQPRHGLQHFLGASGWDWSAFLAELTRQADAALAAADGVVTLNLLGFPKKGDSSVGVARQPGGPSGAPENCQVAVYLGYASGKGAAVVDVRLYLPRVWTRDRARRRRCGVPPRLSYHSHAQLAAGLLGRLGDRLPHGWVAADAGLGGQADFRQALQAGGHRYLVAVPPTTLVRPFESGRPGAKFSTAQDLAGSVVSPGRTPPRPQQVTTFPTLTPLSRRAQRGETLVVITRSAPPLSAADYYLSNAPADVAAEEWNRVAAAAPRTADYLRGAVQAAGLASYEVRTWVGWHHHQTLALVAMWLLQQQPAPPGWAGAAAPDWRPTTPDPAPVSPP